MNVRTKFEVRSFTRSWDNSDWIFVWGCEPQSWGRGGRMGSEMVPLERWWFCGMCHLVTNSCIN